MSGLVEIVWGIFMGCWKFKMEEELTIKDLVSLLIKENLARADRDLFIGSKKFSVKAYRVGVRLFRIDIMDVEE